ncbi:hypothetical protein BD410DRAFT_810531 [Rickenella mellea]|uniref:Uncharacterized protein n=1 Tax=Rickenella mellea TaxID=50990 RepID=A0A4Y7PDY5_9AGAM|nr:hypothetical protein BD410DRAFT_810531 [Rickenella mellea]
MDGGVESNEVLDCPCKDFVLDRPNPQIPSIRTPRHLWIPKSSHGMVESSEPADTGHQTPIAPCDIEFDAWAANPEPADTSHWTPWTPCDTKLDARTAKESTDKVLDRRRVGMRSWINQEGHLNPRIPSHMKFDSRTAEEDRNEDLDRPGW